ncbi:hypothetical protein NW765_017636 [Fusarium oxysporum]|nr:hypothetical protein NW765_017636 [Fusarium oxysporum]KAJ4264146.1 hypothetical protein NW764_015954 [Fusarium oxysporum]
MATYESAIDRYAKVGDVKFAYRLIGPRVGIPLVFLMHYRGTMDHWDPALINPLAERRPILLIDNAGVGRSTGEIPKDFSTWAQHYANVVTALGFDQVDVLGFSMGGCVAQMLALNAPALVRRLVLCSTIPSSGPGVVTAPLGPFNKLKAASTDNEHRQAFLLGFFTSSESSQAAGNLAWQRIMTARKDRSGHVSSAGARNQGIAFMKFMDPKLAEQASFNRLGELSLPVLIANGSEDAILPTDNSILMWKKLKHMGAQLHLFPDSGHGFFHQHPAQFADIVNSFLGNSRNGTSKI